MREVVDILRSTPVDTRRLGEIFRQAHESLRVDFEVSTPELDGSSTLPTGWARPRPG